LRTSNIDGWFATSIAAFKESVERRADRARRGRTVSDGIDGAGASRYAEGCKHKRSSGLRSRLAAPPGQRRPRRHRHSRIHARARMQVSAQSSSATCLSPKVCISTASTVRRRPVTSAALLSRDHGCRCLQDGSKQRRMLFDEYDRPRPGTSASALPRSRSRERAGAGDCSCRCRSRPIRASAIRRKSAIRRC
jgi:hypothetical protein